MLTELLTTPGVTESSRLAGPVGLMAFHGGSLERVTDQIVDAVAARCDVSTYIIRQPEGFRWHVPSTAFDPAESPALARFVEHVEVAIAVHGYGRDQMYTTLLAGGQHRELAAHLAGHLRAALPEYTTLDDLDLIPATLRGLRDENPVNLVRDRGVQLELPPRVRGLGPFWGGEEPRIDSDHTQSLVDALVAACTTW